MVFFFLPLSVVAAQGPINVRIGSAGQFVVDGKAVFPIGFTTGPPVGGNTPDGTNGFAELAKNGFVFFQWLSHQQPWGPGPEAQLDSLMKEANQYGIKIAPSVASLADVTAADQERMGQLESVVKRYRDNPSMFLWKGVDEPQWGKVPPENLKAFFDTVHRLDPNHLVWVTQAPRGTAEDWVPYAKYYDVGAVDIYAVAYPPISDSGLIPNKNISVVGDYTKRIREINGSQKGLLMTLQICWSGVAKPGRTLRFPTFPEERYMSYQAVIDGARALVYFGGNVESCLSERDSLYGWNWGFYQRVLEPVLEEFRPESELYPALIAPNSSLPIHVDGGTGLEFTVREAGNYIYVLAAKREGETLKFTFSGLPQDVTDGKVLFESPRRVTVTDGKFSDWFGPNEVHVYRFLRRPPR
jgi:hypothetical protein